jgi:FliG C-terminal domain
MSYPLPDMRGLLLTALLAAVPAAAFATPTDEAAAAARLSAHVQGALDAVLGPGRAKVQIDVRGERLEMHSSSELVTPLSGGTEDAREAQRYLDLPGFVAAPSTAPAAARATRPAAAPTFFERDRQQSDRDGGFQIDSIQAVVILDSTLPKDAVARASQLLPQLLRLDTQRGDTLTILRAKLRPAWKSAFATPSDWRAAAYAAAAVLALLLAALIGGSSLVRAGRALGRELAASRARAELPLAPGTGGEPLPELTPGAPPGYLEGGAAGVSGETPRLGRRFDFLAGREPGLIERALGIETPESLALLFGHLSDSAPNLASRLFASLSEGVQAAVSRNLLSLRAADPERLAALEERLRAAVENGVSGPESLGRILSRVSGEARADLLGLLAAGDARGVEEVERHVFAFEDLESLPPVEFRRLLAAASYEAWGAALRGAPAALADRVLADLPEGPRRLVREAVEAPQPRDKVVEARSRILDAAAALAAKGELAVGRRGGDLV